MVIMATVCAGCDEKSVRRKVKKASETGRIDDIKKYISEEWSKEVYVMLYLKMELKNCLKMNV